MFHADSQLWQEIRKKKSNTEASDGKEGKRTEIDESSKPKPSTLAHTDVRAELGSKDRSITWDDELSEYACMCTCVYLRETDRGRLRANPNTSYF